MVKCIFYLLILSHLLDTILCKHYSLFSVFTAILFIELTHNGCLIGSISTFYGGARGVMVIVAGYGHGDTSSNPRLIAFHIALIPLGKV